MFDVIKLYVTTSNKVRYEVGDAGATISPVYISSNNTLLLTEWNYIAATYKHVKTAANLEVYIQLAIANGESGTLKDVGSATVSLPTFSNFSNRIVIGGNTESTLESFSGYLKDVRFFNKFHSFDQLQIDQLKIYQPYNYDDVNLIAQW